MNEFTKNEGRTTPGDVPRESSRTILFQFVVFPLGVVLIGVAVFLLFGKLASNESSIPDSLNDIRNGSSHRKFQAAYELSKSIKRGEAKRYPNLVEQVVATYRASKDDDPRIRQYLTLVLGKLGDKRAVPVLVDALNDPVVETRIYALIALAELHDPGSVSAVIAATKDEDKDVRKTAIYSLGEIGGARALPVLEEALNDQVADIRFNAALGLSRFGDRSAEPVLRAMLDRSTLDRVAGMRPDQKEEAIVAASPAYARLAGKSATAELQALANRDESMRVRATAKEALANLR
ncbi:MAG: HEAT repeat domain-containing protein [Thermoanaerobaculia bacterium]